MFGPDLPEGSTLSEGPQFNPFTQMTKLRSLGRYSLIELMSSLR